MALKLNITSSGVNTTGTKLYLADSTGDYAVGTNEGGWGAPNPLRVQTALLFSAYLNKSTGQVVAPMDEYDPLTTSAVSVNTCEDGYYSVYAIGLKLKENSIDGEYCYDTYSKVFGLLTLGAIVPKTVKEIYDDVLFTQTSTVEVPVILRSGIFRNNLLADITDLLIKVDDRGHNIELREAQENYEQVRLLVEGAKYQWCLGNGHRFQTIIEYLTDTKMA